MDVYEGQIVHCVTPEKIEILPNHVIGVDKQNSGKIIFVESSDKLAELSRKYTFKHYKLEKSQFLMPGLVDTHIHAPQYKFTGTGYDKTLLDWLKTYTFPTEASFSSVQVAKDIYPLVVRRTLQQGTTTASYFATIHSESTKELCRIIDEKGQRALVGKVNMDQESPPNYIEDTEKSLSDTKEFVKFVKDMKNPLIQPVITPRFAPSCSEDLLAELGKLAKEMNLPIQSHLCEQKEEIKYTLDLFPGYKNCTSIFEKAGMVHDKCYMAHCVHLENEEVDTLKEKGVGVAHCPLSNFCLSSGCLDVRRLLNEGVKVGLGTDVSGGYSSSMLESIRMCLHTSKAVSFQKDQENYTPLTHHEVLYLATMGGAQVLGLDSTIGNFQVGKEFDALLIDTRAPVGDPVFDVCEGDSFDDCLSKFLYLGDDRNILKRFVAGKEIKL